MEQYEALRRRYPRFFYRGYEIEETDAALGITYHFEIEGLSSFAPKWTFPKSERSGDIVVDGLMERMIFSLGMVELVSYWKITCSPQVVVEAGALNWDQIRWWKDLYYNGLGEFFYVNKIRNADPDGFMEIECRERAGQTVAEHISAAEPAPQPSGRGISGILVPIGGGKDSVVTLELLRQADVPLYGYIINSRGATVHTARVAGLNGSRLMEVKRTLDKNMLELNRQGYLNGHTPFSALVAFSSLIAARLLKLSHVALSNESSANESTVLGSTVNHQYSKSFKFEQDFHRYAAEYLPGSAYYFSLLRPLSEFQIARFFARQKPYHAVFRSCNAGSKTDSWCGHCPKCLFVYVILSPFLAGDEVQAIFGTNMLEDASMAFTLDQLVGVEEEKPFECVGSRDEINTALVMTIDRLEAEGKALPLLLEHYKQSGMYERSKAAGDRYSAYYDHENLVPESLAGLVKRNCVAGADTAIG